MLKLFKHQQEFIDKKLTKALVCHSAGTGKSVTATVWLKDYDSDALVICPKKIVKKWKETLKTWGTKATVLSKEDFKKTPIRQWSAIVFDESDEACSPLYIAKSRSQLSEHFFNQTQKYPCPLLLTTATPIRSTPANLHSALVFLGHNIAWKDWRDKYYELTKKPYMQFMAWLPKYNWRTMIQEDLKKYAHIVNLKDCVDLPPVTEEKIQVKTPKYVIGDDHNFYTEHKWEQQNKLAHIKEIAKGHRKLFLVVYYVEQIEELVKQLKDRPVHVLYGKTKNQEEVIKQAQADEDCYFIVQSGTGAGFDADSFSCMVFVSMGFAVRDWVQMKARIRRIHNLRPVQYVYLQGGRADKRILQNIELGKDFIPDQWTNYQ